MASNISLLNVYSNINYTSNYILNTSNQIINYTKSLTLSGGNYASSSLWNNNNQYISYGNVNIHSNMIKINSSIVNSYINYDFSEDPISQTTLINKGYGTNMNGTITNSNIAQNITLYPTFPNHEQYLIAWYKFDDNATNMLLDSSGSNYNTTGTNASFSTNGIRGNGCLDLTATNARLLNTASFDYGSGNGLTFSVWFKLSRYNTVDSTRLFSASPNSGSQNRIIFDCYNRVNGRLGLSIYNTNSGSGSGFQANFQPALNTWYHVTYVLTKTPTISATIYINGEFNISSTNIYYPISSTSYYTNIGTSYEKSLDFGGFMDDLRIYNKALTAEEVKQVYSIPIPYPVFDNHSSNLVVWHKFDNNVNDSSGNNNNITYFGSNVSYSATTVRGTHSLDLRNTNKDDSYVVKFYTGSLAFNTTETFSIAGWFYVRSSAGITISQGNESIFTDYTRRVAFFGIPSSGYPGLAWYGHDNIYQSTTPAYDFLNKWTHVVVTHSLITRTIKIYVNGILLPSTVNSTSSVTTNVSGNIIIGRAAYSATIDINNANRSDGLVDDLRIYNRELTASEVKQIYGYTLSRTIQKPNDLIPYSYYWNGAITETSDNAYITIPKAGIDPIIASSNLSVYYWSRADNTSNTFSIFNMKKDTSNSYLDIIHDKTDSVVNVINNNTLVSYPEVGATSSASEAGYTSGGYTVRIKGSSAYNTTSHGYWRMFNKVYTEAGENAISGWGWTTNNYYSSGVGTQTTNYFSNDNDYYGEYNMIDLGRKIVLKSYTIYPSGTSYVNRNPKRFRIYATNDENGWTTQKNNTSWVKLDDRTGISWTADTSQTFTITNNTPYRFYGIIIRELNGTVDYGVITEMVLNAYPVYQSTFTNQISANTWNNYALTVNYSNPTLAVSLYKNSVLQSTSNFTNVTSFGFPTDANAHARIGDNSTGTDPSPSYLADFRLYDRALTATDVLNIYNTNYNSIDTLNIHNSATSQNVSIRLTDGSTGTTLNDGSMIRKDLNSAMQLWNFENADMFFGTSNTERMRILADGKIGIGKTPNYTLDVSGDVNISSGKLLINGVDKFQDTSNTIVNTSNDIIKYAKGSFNHPTVVGATINTYGDQICYCAFTSTTGSNSIYFPQTTVCNILMVGGGGAGGNTANSGGGGGGGGFYMLEM